MEKNTDRINERVEFIQEKVDEAISWMGPENTVGDFITVLMENLADELIGDDLLAVTVNELNDKSKASEFLEKLKERDKFGIFDGLHLA